MTDTKSARKMDNETLTIIRTVQRVNLDLKKIADKKANMMVTLNALLFSMLIPVLLRYIEIIIAKNLIIPIGILFMTTLITLVLSVMVLRPFDWVRKRWKTDNNKISSPFMYFNFQKLSLKEHIMAMNFVTSNGPVFRETLMSDMYLEGLMLGEKYELLRMCYNIYLIGLLAAVLSAIIVVLL